MNSQLVATLNERIAELNRQEEQVNASIALPEPFGKPLALAMGMDRKPLVLKRDVVASQLQSSEVSLYF